MSNTIIKINPSDIIADSMDKINYNFEVLSENENQVDYKLSKLSQTFNERLETITTTTTNKHIELNNYIETLENKIDNVSTMEDMDIQGMVTDAIQHADSLLEDIISRVAGEQVDAALGDYAKTSELDALRETVNTSIAADTYFADASKKMASASRIVANSKFYTEHNDVLDKDCWVYNSNNGGEVSTISNLEEFYDSLNPAKQAEIKGDSTEENPLDDPEVVARLVAEAEKTFKQISTELSAFMQSVSGGEAVAQIVAAVRDPNNQNGKEIAAGIFVHANQSGSDITLNADSVRIESQNFKVNNGNVEVTGKIVANELVVNDQAFLDNLSVKHLNGADGTFSGSIRLNPTNTFENNDYVGNIILDNNGILVDGGWETRYFSKMNCTEMRLGTSTMFYGFKQPIKFFDPFHGFENSNTYNATQDDSFIICGLGISPGAGVNPIVVQLNVNLPYVDRLGNYGAVLKIMATGSSVRISNNSVPKHNNTRRLKIVKTVVTKSEYSTVMLPYEPLEYITIDKGQIAYFYTLDSSPEYDDPEHALWFAYILDTV